MKPITISLCLWLPMIIACTTTTGPAPVVNANGPIKSSDPATGPTSIFLNAESQSFASPNDAARAAEMVRTGFSVIYANCSDYFSSAGQTQKWLIFSRDVVGALGTLATGALALTHAGTGAVAGVAFGTGAAYTGLDVYTKNFLFSAENIESVRALVTRALAVHAQAVIALHPKTYDDGITSLLDNQNICSPMSISALAREAIKQGKVTASSDTTPDPADASKVKDDAVLSGIGMIFGLTGPISIDQAGALWWLFNETSTTKERTDIIAPKLSGLPAAKSLIDKSGAIQKDWPYQKSVVYLLSLLSDATKQSFKNTISLAEAASPGSAAAAAPPPGAPVANFMRANVISPSGSTRVSIMVK